VSWRLAIVANVLALGFLGFSGWLQAAHPEVYYASAQEDQALEWASFWSFFAASIVFVIAARRQRRTTDALPWFVAGLALFCFLVAMEEISWGQRVFGHRPPEYFLAENYQQELNLHNIAGRDLRVWTFRVIVLGYGVVLPLLTLIPPLRRRLDRIAIVAPPVELMPSMFAVFWLHLHYPWKFTGEITECALGFGFLFAAMANAAQFAGTSRGSLTLARASILPALVVALGFATAAWSQNRQSHDPSYIAQTEAEVQALKEDFIALATAKQRDSVTKCGLHKRLYTFADDKGYARPLAEGAFASLIREGLPRERAEFFLDPWNSPYWIRDRCDEDKGRRSVFIYSFGPNRSRDSNRWEILGDDLGAYLIRNPSP
jgi:hypothetical protein